MDVLDGVRERTFYKGKGRGGEEGVGEEKGVGCWLWGRCWSGGMEKVEHSVALRLT